MRVVDVVIAEHGLGTLCFEDVDPAARVVQPIHPEVYLQINCFMTAPSEFNLIV